MGTGKQVTIYWEHEMGIEDPEPDVIEQQLPLTDPDEDDEVVPARAPLDVDPADFVDQHRDVPTDDEDNPASW